MKKSNILILVFIGTSSSPVHPLESRQNSSTAPVKGFLGGGILGAIVGGAAKGAKGAGYGALVGAGVGLIGGLIAKNKKSSR